jgi:type IX secretion system PorP/SprF family membrane protein
MNDPNFAANIDATIPTVGVGILLNLANFYVGLSSTNIIGDALASNDQNLDLQSPLYGYLGYRFFSNRFEEIMIKPSVLLKQESGAPIQIDTNISFSYKNKFELGTGYRSNSSINLLAGVYLLKNVRALYNYNLTFNDSPLGNTHGIMISYLFGDGYSVD